jgi:lysophospholipase L1-like esterase
MNSVAYLSTGNTLFNGAWGSDTPGPYTTGDVVGVRVDFAARTVRFQRNGGKWSFPMSIALLGPDAFVAVSMQLGTGPAPQLHVTADDWSDFSEPTLNVIAVGDSISLTGGVMRTYLPRLADMIRADRKGWARTHRFGVNGASWDFAWEPSGYPYTLIEDIPRRVVPALSPTLPNWVIAFAGTNGIALARRDAEFEYSRLRAYVTALKAAGVPADQIVVPTMLPRNGIPESTRATYNAAIVADAGRLGYRVARLDLDPDVGAAGQAANPTWYRDGVHPTDAGHEAIARILYATMFP